MKFINGRGQLGKNLLKMSSKFEGHFDDIIIYHTWNFIDKTAITQAEEVQKLKSFLQKTPKDKKIVFISTTTEKETSYVKCKREAEKSVLKHNSFNLVIRLPCIIGKGVFAGLRDGKLDPCGKINFISMREACDFIWQSLSRWGIIECPHWTVSAETIKDLIDFAKK